MNLKFGKAGSMNLSATFDTYMYEVTSSGSPYHIDKPRWEAGRLPRLMNTGYSYSYSLSNDKLAQWFGLKDKDDDAKVNAMTQAAEDEMEDTPNEDADPFAVMEEKPRKSKNSERKSGSKYDADGYLFWSVPWSMNISYTMRYAYSTFNVKKKEYNLKLTHSATVSGSIQPTQNWNFSYNFTYDINAHEVTYMNINCTRDMHCWNLTASLNPMGQYASFNVCVAVKASMLRDMKYEKTSVSRSNKINWYDD
jgi:hypothetical protein